MINKTGYGESGCYQVKGNIIAGNNIYCDGWRAWYNVGGTIQGINVSVSGNRGAFMSTINATDEVKCSGYSGCYGSVINAGNHVIVEANYAAYGAYIIAEGNVHCEAESSCASSIIHSGGFVAGRSTHSLTNSTITGVTVVGYGFESLSYSDIIQISGQPLRVVFSGYDAGENTKNELKMT